MSQNPYAELKLVAKEPELTEITVTMLWRVMGFFLVQNYLLGDDLVLLLMKEGRGRRGSEGKQVEGDMTPACVAIIHLLSLRLTCQLYLDAVVLGGQPVIFTFYCFLFRFLFLFLFFSTYQETRTCINLYCHFQGS